MAKKFSSPIKRKIAQWYKEREANTAAVEAEKAFDKARKNRQRKYQCPRCEQIARGTRSTLLLCGVCYEMDEVIVRLTRIDPLPEEISTIAPSSENAA